MASGDALVSFKIEETADIKALRNAGHFTSASVTAQRQRNIRLAEALRGQVVRRMENHINFGKRAGVSTHRLVRVTADARNSYADQWNVGVGRPDYLNRSIAKYWRTFEEGSAAVWSHPFAGTQLRGMFGGSIIGYAHTRTPGPQPQPLAGGPWNAPGGKLRWYWSMPLNDNFRVRHEIQGAHIYKQVGEEAHLDEYGVQIAQRLIGSIFSRGLNPPEPMGSFYNMRG